MTVTASPECPWTVSTGAPWLSELSPTSGQGNGTVQYRAAPNPLPAVREGEIVVNDDRVRLSQQAAPCRFGLAPDNLAVDASGGTRGVQVSATSGCAWTLTTDVAWISLATPATGSGDATAMVTIAAHTGQQPRVGTITLGDQRVTVTQAGVPPAGCAYDVGPAVQAIAATGGTGLPVTVTTTAGCSWTAASTVPWITITAGASGTGSGAAAFIAAANPGAARSGTILVAGQTVTVSQAAAGADPGCSYAVSATGGTIAASGGTGSISVSAGAGCPWNVVNGAPWITITAGASGSGTGAVVYSVAANTGSARTGIITVAGQPVTVTQAAGSTTCTYTISATTATMPAPGGTGAVDVTAASGCAWTASTSAPWITVTAGASGTGNGTMAFTVAANTGAARTGTLTVAGQTFTVDQAAAPVPCTYTLSAPGTTVPAPGGTGSVDVSTASGCAWTASSNASWITVTAGASGTGSGTVAFTVAANTGAARTGTLTVAGQTFTVDQAAAPVPCTYTLSATSASLTALGGAGSVGVAAASTCSWTATSNDAWITVLSGASGSGDGTVAFVVAPNLGAARTGTITVAGQTFTVNQAAVLPSCTYTISPTSITLQKQGGTGSVTVSASASTCAWTATSNVSWISITSGASGTGNGAVAFSVASKSSNNNRTGTLTIAGRTFTVTQK